MAMSEEELFHQLLQEAHDDPEIVGLVLTGSRGQGFGSEASDFDLLLIVREEALAAYRTRFYEEEPWTVLDDLWVSSLPELEPIAASWGEPLAWEEFCNLRYSFANVSVLVDKTGQLQRLVDDKGFVPEEHRLPVVRAALGAYTNSLYRPLKCLGNGNRLGARLEAVDAIAHALTVIFALEGRHRPYYGYLERELAIRPLETFPLAAGELLAAIDTILDSADAATQQRLLGIVEPLGRQVGCDEAFDEWGDRFAWMKQYRPDDPSK
jgi:hypothetical protein